MCVNNNLFKNNQQSGVTLVELIVFIVIVGVAIVGVLKALQVANRDSVDPVSYTHLTLPTSDLV